MTLSEHDKYIEISKTKTYNYWKNDGRPFLSALIKFYECLDFECVNRKIKSVRIEWMKKILKEESSNIKYSKRKPILPTKMTTGYRIILLSKNIKYYKKFFSRTVLKRRKDIDLLIKDSSESKTSKLLGIN